MTKKMAYEEEKIRAETRKKTQEEHELKDREKDKKLQDAIKANDDLRRKLEQGSQQTQGEVLELAIEELVEGVVNEKWEKLETRLVNQKICLGS